MDVLLYVAIIPIIILLNYVKKQDPHPENGKLLRKIFIFGCISSIVAIIGETAFDHLWPYYSPIPTYSDIFVENVIGVALIEESVKWLVIWWLCYRNRDFDETYDAIVYAAYSSLGFACVENILYVLMYGIGTGIVRAFTSIPGHLCFAVIMGYFLGRARLAKSKGEPSAGFIMLSLAIPTLIHGMFDFLLSTDNAMHICIWFVFILVLFIFCFNLVSRSAKHNEAICDGATTTTATAAPSSTSSPATPSNANSPTTPSDGIPPANPAGDPPSLF